jgi:hypothetical protein
MKNSKTVFMKNCISGKLYSWKTAVMENYQKRVYKKGVLRRTVFMENCSMENGFYRKLFSCKTVIWKTIRFLKTLFV